jgi:nitroreductase
MSEDPGLFEIMRTCRAMRRLKPDPVPEDLLVRLVEAAQWGPSGSNQQTGRWLILREQAGKDRIAALNKAAVERYLAGRRETVAALPEALRTSQSRILDAVQWQAEHMQEAPAIIISCLAMAAAPRDTWEAGFGAGGSVWPGVQNLLLAARGLGLAAALTTLAMTDRTAFKAAAGLPEGIEPVCVVPVGYPTGSFGPVRRRPVSEVLRWERWS